MTKSERSTLFTLLTSLLNIVLTLGIELGIITGLFFFINKMGYTQENIPLSVVLPFVLLAGLLLSFVLFVRICAWIIRTFGLEDKIDQKIVNRYIKEDRTSQL